MGDFSITRPFPDISGHFLPLRAVGGDGMGITNGAGSFMGIGYLSPRWRVGFECDKYYGREVYSGLARGLGSYCWVGVMKGDFAIVLMIKLLITTFTNPRNIDMAIMFRETCRVMEGVMYPNNIREWDWEEAIGESWVPDKPWGDDQEGDKFLYIRWWWPKMPPLPIGLLTNTTVSL